MRLLGGVGDENGEVTVIRIKIRGRAPVSFCERIAPCEEVTALLFLHFNDGTFEFSEEIENLGGLRGPFLLPHALVEDDLFFVLQDLEVVARVIQ
jgi:hypothetical protein